MKTPFFTILCLLTLPLFAEDKLAAIFPAGEDWQVAADGLTFPDGLSGDADGNIYFCDMNAKPPTLWKLSPDGEKTKVASARRSGTRVGPDGRLYACGDKKVAAYDIATGKEEILADNLQPNDLTVTSKGSIYITETAKHQVTCLDPKTKEMKPADVGINKPNGIATSADGLSILVSDNGGVDVFSMKIQPDGTLADKKSVGTMKCGEKKPGISGGDGMTVDSTGRSYVTTYTGLQIFSPEGELLGVLAKPQEKNLINAAFGGKDLQYLYVACGDKVYRRKTLTKGSLSYQHP